jgi:IclR family transcriptional regulator, acetate operon repressor
VATNPPQEAADRTQKLRSLSRALDILELLGQGPAEGLAVGDVAEGIQVSRSTAFALLQTLIERGFVADVRLGGSRRYRLGLALVKLGDQVLAGDSLSQVATPVLQQLTQTTGFTSRLAVLDDGYAVAVARVDAPGPFRLSTSLGRRELPHCSAVGKAILSGLPEPDVRAMLKRLGMPRRTPKTLTTPLALMKDLQRVRERGFAFDDEEDHLGVVCVGAAIYDASGQAVAAISVTGMKQDRNPESLMKLGQTVRTHADRISRLLGGPDHLAWCAFHTGGPMK